MPYNSGNPDLEIVVDERSALAKFKALSRAYSDYTSGVVKDSAKIDEAMKAFESSVVNVNNRAQQSQERYLKSLERTAAVYGQSGADKLRSQRDHEIRQLGSQADAIKRVTAAYDSMIKKAEEAARKGGGEGGGGHGFSSPGMLAFRGLKDLFEGRTGYGEVMLARSAGLDKLVLGLSGAQAAVAGLAGGMLALGVASFHAYKSLGEYGQELSNISARTGLGLHEVQAFSFAATAAGEDVSVFTRAMRGLTAASYDESVAGDKARQWMTRFGIDSQSLRDGTLSTAEAMKLLGQGFASLPAGVERTRAEIELLKRAGIESGPVFIELTRNLREFESHGFGQSDDQLRRLKEYHDSWHLISTAVHDTWVDLQLILAAPIGAVAGFVARGGSGTRLGEALRTPLLPPQLHGAEWQGPTAAQAGIPERNAALLSAYHAGLGVEYKLREAERALAATPTPGFGQGALPDQITARTAAERRVESAKEAVKFYEQHKATIKALRKVSIEESERVAHPYGFIPADRMLKTFAELPGGPDVEAARRLLSPLRRAQVLEMQQKAIALGAEGAERAAIATGVTGEAKSPEQLSQQIRDRAAASNRAFLEQRKLAEEQRAEAQRTTIDTLREQRRSEEVAGLSAARISATLAPDTIEARLANEQRIAQVRLKTIADEYRENVASAKAVYDSELKLEELRLKNVHEVAAVQAQLDESRAGEIRRQLDDIKGASKGLFETLFTHPGQFGGQLGSTIRAAVLSPITSGLGNLTARALHPLIFGSTGTGGIAGGLRGAFGGTHVSPTGTTTDPVAVTVVGVSTQAATSTGAVPSGGYFNWAARAYGRGSGGGSISQPLGGAAMMAMLSGLSFAGSGGQSGGGGGGVPAGQIQYGSSDITGLYNSGIFPGAPGGTSGFSGPVGLNGGGGGGGTNFGWPGGGAFPSGSTGGGGFNLGGLLPNRGGFSLSGLRDMFFNSGSIALGGGRATTAAGIGGIRGSLAGALTSQGAASLYLAAGTPLAMAGLTGMRRGTGAGVLESTGGGALVGAGIGTMILPGIGTAIGAGVGALAGLGAGLGEMIAGVESPRNEAKRLVHQQYGLSINNPTADQIVGISQHYGGRVSVAVRSPEVRQMLGLYAAGTGQSLAPSASTPHGAGLVESGGSLFQQTQFQYGRGYAYPSSLPTYGGGGGPVGAFASPGGSGPTYISLNVGDKSAADFMTGQYITPSYVQSAQATAWKGSQGRQQAALTLAAPGEYVS